MTKTASSTDYHSVDDGSLFGANAEDFDKWDSQQLADFLASAGLMAYRKMVLDHKITGKFAHLLTDEDLRDMGMIVVGDRLRFKQLMMTMGRKARFCNSTKAIWTGEEQTYYSDIEHFVCTCMGLIPDGKHYYSRLSLEISWLQIILHDDLTIFMLSLFLSVQIPPPTNSQEVT